MSNADLLTEAIDAAVRLFYAGAGWLLLCAVVATLALYAVAVIAWAVVRAGRRTASAAWARAHGCAPTGAPHSPSCDSRDAGDAPKPPQRRSRPSWAHEQPTTYEEAA